MSDKPFEKPKYLHKSVIFNPADEQDMKLLEWLRSLPHGDFSNKTKQFWLDKMKEEKK